MKVSKTSTLLFEAKVQMPEKKAEDDERVKNKEHRNRQFKQAKQLLCGLAQMGGSNLKANFVDT